VAVTRDELNVWIKYIYEICGISLDQTKGYLVETRLAPLLREAGVSTFAELYYRAKSDTTQRLRRQIIDAITTNETSFFRDASPFDLIQHKLVPDLIDRRTKAGRKPVPIRIWSAACSTGQEVYSIGIALLTLLGDMRGYDVRILGTDISDKAVAQASHAYYNKLELDRGMSPDKLRKYFTLEGERWKVRDELRALATFKTMNLLEPFTFPLPFDIVFCRNVAIYFTEPDRQRLFRSIRRAMAPDGALIIGSTESITGICPEFESQRYLRSVFYRLRGSTI
jgi:chemotaxis protein methyltransferase CheR